MKRTRGNLILNLQYFSSIQTQLQLHWTTMKFFIIVRLKGIMFQWRSGITISGTKWLELKLGTIWLICTRIVSSSTGILYAPFKFSALKYFETFLDFFAQAHSMMNHNSSQFVTFERAGFRQLLLTSPSTLTSIHTISGKIPFENILNHILSVIKT